MGIEEIDIGRPLRQNEVVHAGFSPASGGLGRHQRAIEECIDLRAPQWRDLHPEWQEAALKTRCVGQHDTDGLARGGGGVLQDDGEGFNLEEARKKGGLGLVSMKERVRLVNGFLFLRSEPGKGSTVEVVVPIAIASAAAVGRQEHG